MNWFISCCLNKFPQTHWLKTTQFIILQFCSQKSKTSLTGLKWRQGCFPFWRLKENPRPYLFQLLESATFLMASSCIFEASMLHLSDRSSVATSPLDHSQEKSSSFNNPCGYTGPTQIILDNPLISRSLTLTTPVRTFMPRIVIHSQDPGIGTWRSLWGVGIILPTTGHDMEKSLKFFIIRS